MKFICNLKDYLFTCLSDKVSLQVVDSSGLYVYVCMCIYIYIYVSKDEER